MSLHGWLRTNRKSNKLFVGNRFKVPIRRKTRSTRNFGCDRLGDGPCICDYVHGPDWCANSGWVAKDSDDWSVFSVDFLDSLADCRANADPNGLSSFRIKSSLLNCRRLTKSIFLS